MEDRKLNLLELPREIRDRIYYFTIRQEARKVWNGERCSHCGSLRCLWNEKREFKETLCTCHQSSDCAYDPNPIVFDGENPRRLTGQDQLAVRGLRFTPLSYACRQLYSEVVPLVFRASEFKITPRFASQLGQMVERIPLEDPLETVRKVVFPCSLDGDWDRQVAVDFLRQCPRIEILTLKMDLGENWSLPKNWKRSGTGAEGDDPEEVLQRFINKCKLGEVVKLPFPHLEVLEFDWDLHGEGTVDMGYFTLDHVAPLVEGWLADQWKSRANKVEIQSSTEVDMKRWVIKARRVMNAWVRDLSMLPDEKEAYTSACAEMSHFHYTRIAMRNK
ncbi:hypothetical protein BS50DRAFT_569438 [Corynespora cassiicola Philippines]|uniref:DUF7730 domain-containing protein n=1 Tax=Corynespora cassiicola Philippines TaxID=1448308 RepID=A0A2T2P3B5_CORCC|nr:hypothetical protein BS50DRAFT_569438 [Corynespora cassiicola Philippines]